MTSGPHSPHSLTPARPTTWGSTLLALTGWVALGLTFLPDGSVPRAAGAIAFLLVCPGAALIRHWPAEEDLLSRSVLSVAISMALTVLVAQGLILVGAWSARLALVILATVTSFAGIVRPTRRAHP